MEVKLATPVPVETATAVGVLSPDDVAVLGRVNPAFDETNADGRELLVGYVEEGGALGAIGIRPSAGNYHDYSVKPSQRPGVWQVREYDLDGNTVGFAQVSRYPGADGDGPRYDFSVLDAQTGTTRFASPAELARQMNLLSHVANARDLAAAAGAVRPEASATAAAPAGSGAEVAAPRGGRVAQAILDFFGLGHRA